MYSDDTILTKGKYKFTAIGRVPAAYLINIYNKKNKSDAELYAYVEKNLQSIENRLVTGQVSLPLSLPCKKVAFFSEKAAKEALSDISNSNDDHVIPIRSYHCEICGGFHLTSWSIEDYKKSLNKH